MKDGEILRKALDVLGWSPERLKAELDCEVSEGGQKTAMSTVYRWLGDSSPVPAAVKAFLRSKMELEMPLRAKPPKEKTVVLVVGPGGSGCTPLAYESAYFLRKNGVRAKVVEGYS